MDPTSVNDSFRPKISDKPAVQLNANNDNVTEERLENLELGFVDAVDSKNMFCLRNHLVEPAGS